MIRQLVALWFVTVYYLIGRDAFRKETKRVYVLIIVWFFCGHSYKIYFLVVT